MDFEVNKEIDEVNIIKIKIGVGMKNKIFLLILFLLSTTIAILNIYAGRYFWYWRFWWFDLAMHFMGGIAVALVLLYFYGVFNLKEKIKLISLILFSTFTIAVSWEIMEFLIDANLFGKNYFFDTLTDIFIGLIGALIVFFMSNKIGIVNSREETNV
ncbi:hypothetical protein KJ991_02815 [Patescibacteria group bacterium]|nr:hypothetical protein [Patescibacteria group bacterium]MBU4057567.1 hypothetical protein [Patescibacteria group bacterium]MBU4115751.1 hypothetical protein [Patescibacteria group bacterium]